MWLCNWTSWFECTSFDVQSNENEILYDWLLISFKVTLQVVSSIFASSFISCYLILTHIPFTYFWWLSLSIVCCSCNQLLTSNNVAYSSLHNVLCVPIVDIVAYWTLWSRLSILQFDFCIWVCALKLYNGVGN